jgi:preprotein translocase subunit SecD
MPIYLWAAVGILMAICIRADASPFELRAVVDEDTVGAIAYTLKYPAGQETLYVAKAVLVNDTMVKSAEVTPDPSEPLGFMSITITFTPDRAQRIKDWTSRHIGKRLGILFGGNLDSAPVISFAIPDGVMRISGTFSRQEAEDLARKINDAAHAGR